ncbi:excisionase [Butyrivibrio sp. FCS014]|uniref:excisionase n=1 Tax=Butyrivibrio sp. FCS014 TaxID=1408304 RepID=UPI003FA49888
MGYQFATKSSMTVEEAFEYSNIGINRIKSQGEGSFDSPPDSPTYFLQNGPDMVIYIRRVRAIFM